MRTPGAACGHAQSALRWRGLRDERCPARPRRRDRAQRPGWRTSWTNCRRRRWSPGACGTRCQPSPACARGLADRRLRTGAAMPRRRRGAGACNCNDLRAGLQREAGKADRAWTKWTRCWIRPRIQLDETLGLLERIRGDLDLDPRRCRRSKRLVRVLGPGATGSRRTGWPRTAMRWRWNWNRWPMRISACNASTATSPDPVRLGRRGHAARRIAPQGRRYAGAGGRNPDRRTRHGGPGRWWRWKRPPTTHRMPMAPNARISLVSANAGQLPRPLRKVAPAASFHASLAIEVATLGLDAVPTMVFDEVDSGIGGAVAAAVGAKLRALGDTRQVLCVIHQPQVAAAGRTQYRSTRPRGTASPSRRWKLDAYRSHRRNRPGCWAARR